MLNTFYFVLLNHAFARGGGGGSAGGGGGFGGGSYGGVGMSSGNSAVSGFMTGLIVIVFIVSAIVALVYNYLNRKKLIETSNKTILEAELSDSAWNKEALLKRVSEVFYAFQSAWSNLSAEEMRSVVSERYYKRMVLEMNVLQNQHRKNLVENPKIISMQFIAAKDEAGNNQDSFSVEIVASAHDRLLDTESNKNLFVDISTFTEYWTFVRENNEWKLGLIKQSTENAASLIQSISDFSTKNDFFYDPDFGWLMLPNKGVLFNNSRFGTSDINNHVIGYFRGKIIEFYSYESTPDRQGAKTYVIAQAILPKSYKDIYVVKKKLFNLTPRGLRKISTELNDFNKNYCVFADPQDQVSSFELLSPNFMEKINGLDFDLNIEVVGNFLYLFTERGTDYDQMLQILSWAFDEMKM